MTRISILRPTMSVLVAVSMATAGCNSKKSKSKTPAAQATKQAPATPAPTQTTPVQTTDAPAAAPAADASPAATPAPAAPVAATVAPAVENDIPAMTPDEVAAVEAEAKDTPLYKLFSQYLAGKASAHQIYAAIFEAPANAAGYKATLQLYVDTVANKLKGNKEAYASYMSKIQVLDESLNQELKEHSNARLMEYGIPGAAILVVAVAAPVIMWAPMAAPIKARIVSAGKSLTASGKAQIQAWQTSTGKFMASVKAAVEPGVKSVMEDIAALNIPGRMKSGVNFTVDALNRRVGRISSGYINQRMLKPISIDESSRELAAGNWKHYALEDGIALSVSEDSPKIVVVNVKKALEQAGAEANVVSESPTSFASFLSKKQHESLKARLADEGKVVVHLYTTTGERLEHFMGPNGLRAYAANARARAVAYAKAKGTQAGEFGKAYIVDPVSKGWTATSKFVGEVAAADMTKNIVITGAAISAGGLAIWGAVELNDSVTAEQTKVLGSLLNENNSPAN